MKGNSEMTLTDPISYLANLICAWSCPESYFSCELISFLLDTHIYRPGSQITWVEWPISRTGTSISNEQGKKPIPHPAVHTCIYPYGSTIPGTQHRDSTHKSWLLSFFLVVYFKKVLDWAQEYNGIYRILMGPRALVFVYTPESVKVCIIHVNNCL